MEPSSWFDTSAFSSIQQHIDAAVSEAKKSIDDAGGFDMLNLDNLAEEEEEDDDDDDYNDEEDEEEVHHHGNTPGKVHGIHTVNLTRPHSYNSPPPPRDSRDSEEDNHVQTKVSPQSAVFSVSDTGQTDDWDWNTPAKAKPQRQRGALSSSSPSKSKSQNSQKSQIPSSPSFSHSHSLDADGLTNKSSIAVQDMVAGIKNEMAKDKHKDNDKKTLSTKSAAPKLDNLEDNTLLLGGGNGIDIGKSESKSEKEEGGIMEKDKGVTVTDKGIEVEEEEEEEELELDDLESQINDLLILGAQGKRDKSKPMSKSISEQKDKLKEEKEKELEEVYSTANGFPSPALATAAISSSPHVNVNVGSASKSVSFANNTDGEDGDDGEEGEEGDALDMRPMRPMRLGGANTEVTSTAPAIQEDTSTNTSNTNTNTSTTSASNISTSSTNTSTNYFVQKREQELMAKKLERDLEAQGKVIYKGTSVNSRNGNGSSKGRQGPNNSNNSNNNNSNNSNNSNNDLEENTAQKKKKGKNKKNKKRDPNQGLDFFGFGGPIDTADTALSPTSNAEVEASSVAASPFADLGLSNPAEAASHDHTSGSNTNTHSNTNTNSNDIGSSSSGSDFGGLNMNMILPTRLVANLSLGGIGWGGGDNADSSDKKQKSFFDDDDDDDGDDDDDDNHNDHNHDEEAGISSASGTHTITHTQDPMNNGSATPSKNKNKDKNKAYYDPILEQVKRNSTTSTGTGGTSTSVNDIKQAQSTTGLANLMQSIMNMAPGDRTLSTPLRGLGGSLPEHVSENNSAAPLLGLRGVAHGDGAGSVNRAAGGIGDGACDPESGNVGKVVYLGYQVLKVGKAAVWGVWSVMLFSVGLLKDMMEPLLESELARGSSYSSYSSNGGGGGNGNGNGFVAETSEESYKRYMRNGWNLLSSKKGIAGLGVLLILFAYFTLRSEVADIK